MSDIQELDARFGPEPGRAVAVQARAGQATMVEQARAIAEVRAAVMIAMDRPRDRTTALAEMREVCKIKGLADRAFFRVKRGREMVNGPSIHLARELARIWGNIDFGVKELARDDLRGQSELLAFAWDMQTNARSEITFIVPHARGSGDKRYQLTGTQEIYENNASFAGRRLREMIFAVLPVWFREEAADLCHETIERGEGDKPLVQRIADLRGAFAELGVTAEQLEQKRGRRIDDFLADDIAALRIVYGSLKRGEVTISEEFASEEQTAHRPAGGKLDALEHVVATSADPYPDSLPGTTSGNPASQTPSSRKDDVGGRTAPLHAGESTQEPGGEINDMFGGKARKPAGYYKVRREGDTADDWAAWLTGLRVLIENPADPNAAVLRDNRDDLAIFEQIDAMEHNKLMRKLEAK